jgi:hypothetical protein
MKKIFPGVEARAAGLKRYIGVDCLQGHGGERFASNGRCVQCHKIKKQAAKKYNRKYGKVGRPKVKRTPEEAEAIRLAYNAKALARYKTPEATAKRKEWLKELSDDEKRLSFINRMFIFRKR